MKRYSDTGLYSLQCQVHSKLVLFNDFKDITEESLERIKKLIEQKKNKKEVLSLYSNKGLENYIETLEFISSNNALSRSNWQLFFNNFDEKVLYLILSTDPDLVTYRTFIKTDIPSVKMIESASDRTKEFLNLKRKKAIGQFITDVRSQIGFYDEYLLLFERKLKNSNILKAELETDVKIPSLTNLLRLSAKVTDLSSINESELERIKTGITKWQIDAKDQNDLNSLAYNLLNSSSYFNINGLEEQLITFMLIADPELNLLRIYEEESQYPKFERRAYLELGFVDRHFVKLEKMYHDKFEPNRFVSPWTK